MRSLVNTTLGGSAMMRSAVTYTATMGDATVGVKVTCTSVGARPNAGDVGMSGALAGLLACLAGGMVVIRRRFRR